MAGNPDAQKNCADMLFIGSGVEKNIELALDYYVKSAKNGNNEAKVRLAAINSHSSLDIVTKLKEIYTNLLNTAYSPILEYHYLQLLEKMNPSPEVIKHIIERYRDLSEVDRDVAYHFGLLNLFGNLVEKNITDAIKYLKIASNRGLAIASKVLGDIYFTGVEVTKNTKQALDYYRVAADQGDMDSKFQVALMSDSFHESNNYYLHYYCKYLEPDIFFLMDRLPSGDPSKLDLLKLLADNGNVWAMHQVGLAYRDGIGTKTDLNEARNYFLNSSEHEFVPAMLDLISICSYDQMKDTIICDRCIQLLTRCANCGDSNAMYNLGKIYHEGIGVEKNSVSSIEWYKKSANFGNIWAALVVGEILLQSETQTSDAIHYLYNAAKGGLNQAMWDLILYYTQSNDHPDRISEMIQLLSDRAYGGDVDAMLKLYLFYNMEQYRDVEKVKYWAEYARAFGNDWAYNQIKRS